MKTQFFRFTLYSLIIYLTGGTLNLAIAASQLSAGNGTLFCGVIDNQWSKRYSDQYPNRRYAQSFTANLNVGEPRTVRIIYLLPNDRPYRADVVQRMKEEILKVQTFFAEQMGAHGYGAVPFRIETDPQGEPMVHHVDGRHPDSHYLDNTAGAVFDEINLAFNLEANVYLIVIDNSTDLIGLGDGRNVGGVGGRWGKNGGDALVPGEFSFGTAAHELGHAFGLNHDFHDGAYIMSYGGPGRDQLSACHAEYLSVHPYFNLNTPTEEGERPTIELTSPRTYPAGSQSVPVQLKVSDSEGLHQVLLSGSDGLIACRGLAGEKDAPIKFDYNGAFTAEGFTNLSDSMVHTVHVKVVDTDGNAGYASFWLVEISPHHIATFDEHTSGVHSVAFLSDGVTLATGSWDGTVKLWDVVSQQDIATLKVHTYTSAMTFSSDKRTLAAGSWDGTVKLWDVETERDIATFRHTDEVTSVSFSPDGAILATGSRDGTVKLWDVATHRDIGTFEDYTSRVTSVAFSPVDATLLATGSWDRTVKLWDVETQQNIGTFEEHTGGVTSVAFSRDGSTLATGSWDRTVKLWDITTRVNFVTLGHGDHVLSVAFSSDDTTLASGTVAGTVELWDMSGLMGVRLEAVAEIDIPDPNLRAAIAEAIGLPPSTPIFRGHLENLTRLDARNANISDLTGLEGATNLRTLDLSAEYVEAENRSINSNSVSDFSPLTGLTKLRSLSLGGSNISDISTMSGLTSLTGLFLGDNNISNISAVAGLTNLTDLNLHNNSVSDISPVSGLTNLTELYLWGNPISDISPVSGLTNLTRLFLDRNSISDISPVSGLTNLTWLGLGGNSISDILPVSGLTNLTWLGLGGNSISDISPVSGLTNLTWLELSDNSISDISPLVANTGLGGGDTVDVTGNLLSYTSIHTHIPTLQSRRVMVGFDDQAHPALLKISGDNQKGVSGAAPANPFVVEVQDENGSVLEGVPVTFTVTTGGGTLNATRTMTDENGRAESTLTLGPNPGTNTVSVSAAGFEQTVTFKVVSDTEPPPIAGDVNSDGGVNILDLVLVAGAFGNAASAPSAHPQAFEMLTAADVQQWLTDARSLEVKDATMVRGIVVLEQLLASLTPTEIALLPNYPNPFNPETWMPYHLANDADVQITIYDTKGALVRRLDLGHQIAGYYTNRSRAAYWDGRSETGERVSSGLYFYQLSTPSFRQMRRMVILK